MHSLRRGYGLSRLSAVNGYREAAHQLLGLELCSGSGGPCTSLPACYTSQVASFWSGWRTQRASTSDGGASGSDTAAASSGASGNEDLGASEGVSGGSSFTPSSPAAAEGLDAHSQAAGLPGGLMESPLQMQLPGHGTDPCLLHSLAASAATGTGGVVAGAAAACGVLPSNFVVTGPVTGFMSLLDAFQCSTGLPWWATLCGYAVGLRLATLPLSLRQIQTTALTVPLLRMATKGPDDLSEHGGQGQTRASRLPWKVVRQRLRQLREQFGAPSLWWIVAAPLIQVPLFVTSIMAVRGLCMEGTGGTCLTAGGALWFPDLTLPALQLYPVLELPFGKAGVVLPLALALSLARNVENAFGLHSPTKPQPSDSSDRARGQRRWQRAGAVLSPVMGTLGLAAGMTVQQGVVLYWLTSSMCTLAVGSIARLPAVKQYMGLPLMPISSSSSSPLGGAGWQQQQQQQRASPGSGGGAGGSRGGSGSKIHCFSREEAGSQAVDPQVAAFADIETDVDSLFWKAAELRAKGRLADAVHVVGRITALQPGNARAYYALGQMQSRALRWADSEEAYLRCAALERDAGLKARALLSAGIAIKSRGDQEAALKVLRQAEEEAPTPGSGGGSGGEGASSHSAPEGASGSLPPATSPEQDRSTRLHAQLSQAAIHKAQGRYCEAEEALMRARESDPHVGGRFLEQLRQEMESRGILDQAATVLDDGGTAADKGSSTSNP